MKKIGLIFIFLLFNASSFSQWKSYYPEGTVSKKEQKKEEGKKNRKQFEEHLFSALKAKSLENYEEALNYFKKCIKIDKKNPYKVGIFYYLNKRLLNNMDSVCSICC